MKASFLAACLLSDCSTCPYHATQLGILLSKTAAAQQDRDVPEGIVLDAHLIFCYRSPKVSVLQCLGCWWEAGTGIFCSLVDFPGVRQPLAQQMMLCKTTANPPQLLTSEEGLSGSKSQCTIVCTAGTAPGAGAPDATTGAVSEETAHSLGEEEGKVGAEPYGTKSRSRHSISVVGAH